jgi:hypothetical protein
MDPEGNATAVWVEFGENGDDQFMWANRYSRSGGWSGAERIQANDDQSFWFDAAGDAQGNVVAVWGARSDTNEEHVWANRYTPAGGWGTAERISDAQEGGAVPWVAMTPQGDAVAVWIRDGVWSSRFTPSEGWGAAERFSTDVAARFPRVVVDPQGNALAIWRSADIESSPTRTDWIVASRFTVTQGWAADEVIETEGDMFGYLALAGTDDGSAVLVWSDEPGDGTHSVWAKHFDPTDGWSTSEIISVDQSLFPRVAMDSQGNAVAIWNRRESGALEVWANRFTGGWGEPELISDPDNNAFASDIAMDPAGNAIAVWVDSRDLSPAIGTNQFTPSTGWGAPGSAYGGDDAYLDYLPQVAVNAEGHAVTVFGRVRSSEVEVWASILD